MPEILLADPHDVIEFPSHVQMGIVSYCQCRPVKEGLQVLVDRTRFGRLVLVAENIELCDDVLELFLELMVIDVAYQIINRTWISDVLRHLVEIESITYRSSKIASACFAVYRCQNPIHNAFRLEIPLLAAGREPSFFLDIDKIVLYIKIMKLTVKVKLLPTPKQKASLVKTIMVFNDACNYISKIAWQNNKFGQVALHHLCYREVRDKFKLSAQMTVRAIGKVKESYRVDKKTQPGFKKHSALVYDQRILSFRGLDTVSILSLDGRFKIPIVFGSYAKLEQRRIRGQADLLYRKGNLYLCLCIELPDGTPIDLKGTLGVDLGIVNIATTSDGQIFSGKTANKVRQRMTKIKSALQKRGSKSAKRHLKKLSGQEREFKRNINHTISKKIVQIAKDTQQAIALENLKGFRVTVRKEQREQFGKWAFHELRKFIEYKAKLSGIPVHLVNPKNTSRTCSQCGHIAKANRITQSEFTCIQCGFSLNADINGAINIASRADVNQPIAVYSESLLAPVLGTAMP